MGLARIIVIFKAFLQVQLSHNAFCMLEWLLYVVPDQFVLLYTGDLTEGAAGYFSYQNNQCWFTNLS